MEKQQIEKLRLSYDPDIMELCDYALELKKERAELSKLLIEERLFIVQLGETIRDRVSAYLEEGERETEKTS